MLADWPADRQDCFAFSDDRRRGLVEAHSEKEGAQPTFKRGFGFSPVLVFADHGLGGTGECLAGLLRPGKATANNAADHITVLAQAFAAAPEELRARVLVRGDSGAGPCLR